MQLIPSESSCGQAEELGFRFGDKGTHTSRTMMLVELVQVFASTPAEAGREDYAEAIIEGNCLGKPTASTRRLSNQRIGELYCLDPAVAVFRVLRRLWDFDSSQDPLLPLLCAIARDPLLASTVEPVIQLEPALDFNREKTRRAIRASVGDRLSDRTIDKVVRNAASSWTQAGHLEGRTLKVRRRVTPTARSVAYALFLGYAVGFRGNELFSSGWLEVLDCPPSRSRDLALEAKRLGFIDLRLSGDIVEIDFDRLLRPLRRADHVTN